MVTVTDPLTIQVQTSIWPTLFSAHLATALFDASADLLRVAAAVQSLSHSEYMLYVVFFFGFRKSTDTSWLTKYKHHVQLTAVPQSRTIATVTEL